MIGRGLTRICWTAAALAAVGTAAPSAQAANDPGLGACIRPAAVAGRFTYPGDLAEWMTCMYPSGSPAARTKRLGTIVLPGSHDAGTNDFYNAEASTFHYASQCPSPIDRAAAGIPWITRQWSMAQTRSSAEQAAGGARWFDLRGTLDNYVWRSCNGLVADRWFDVFDGLATFHGAHPDEVIVVDLAEVLDPINDVSAPRLAEALAPLCRKAIGPEDAPRADGIAGFVTVQEARSGGGFLLQMDDSARDAHPYTEMARWLTQHPADPCRGKLWSRQGTRQNVDTKVSAELWPHRHNEQAAAARMVRWNTAHLGDSHGAFQISQFTWDYAGPPHETAYQIWLMNHWLIDYNRALGRPTKALGHALWLKNCSTGIPANVVLLDDISRPAPIRALLAYNQMPCP